MKKIAFLIILIILASCLTSSYCEASKNIDLDKLAYLSDDDLLAYDNLLQTEIAKRGLSLHLSDGEYVVGKDIPAGDFLIKYYNFDKPAYECNLYITLYPSIERKTSWEKGDSKTRGDHSDYCVLDERITRATQYKITLEDGQILVIEGSHTKSATLIEKTTSLFSQLGN